MNSLVTGLRNITLHRGRSITRTVAVTVKSKRDIHHVVFENPEHVNTPEKQAEALNAAVEYAAISGLDAAGAESADIALVPLCYTLCCLQSDQSCLAEVSTLASPAPTSFGV